MGITITAGEGGKYRTEVSDVEFAEAFLTRWPSHKISDPKNFTPDFESVYEKLLNIPETEFASAEPLDFWPIVQMIQKEDWTVFLLIYEDRRCAWIVCDGLSLVEFGSSCSIDQRGNIIVSQAEMDGAGVHYGNSQRLYVFEPDHLFWPEVVKNPPFFVALERLDRFTQPTREESKSNPLSELKRAPRPYRMMGHQIGRELEAIRNLLRGSW